MSCYMIFQNKDEEKEFRLLASQLFKEEEVTDHKLRCWNEEKRSFLNLEKFLSAF